MAGWQDWSGRAKRAILLSLVVVFAAATSQVRTATQTVSTFAALSEQLSEPNGDFDTDNLISNESSYLHVIPALEQGGVTGGAYIGVGPDQNFSYIARIRPASAFIIDIRRDNLLMHLLFKALFAASRNRVEYLALLVGRAAPDRADTWRDASIEKIVTYFDAAKPRTAAQIGETEDKLRDLMRKTGVALSDRDLATIDRFHAQFIRAGLGLQFQSTGRPAREYYPTYRDLLLETDRRGRQLCYLASEDDFQFVKSLEARDLVVPVVGNIAGPKALAAIGQEIAKRGEKVSAFYDSNIENYLFRDGSFARFVENVKKLPHTEKSVIIRSLFGGYNLPESVPGYYSTSAIQTIDRFLANCGASRCRGYFDVLK
ncbi:MAG TPA: hypothetical protein VN628_20220 [Vicinamibacterales bacterium]|nr:hypothetical protein [Vicinamibacterales bacterium]